MRRAFELLAMLGDGAEHSGSELATRLGVTRAAVWNHVEKLRDQGVDILATPRRGYYLREGFEALDADSIRAALTAQGCAVFRRIDAVAVTDSTNEQLLQAARDRDIHGQVMLAEFQTAGRGRRGDRWLSAPGSGLCMSLGWRFDPPPATFSALSLVVGFALVAALRDLGVEEAMLKWPNDIVCRGAKLAGILIEMRSEAGGPCVTVIGIGLNIHLSDAAREHIGRPAGGYLEAGGNRLSRNLLAATLLARLANALETFAVQGFAPFRHRWAACDALADCPVRLELPGRIVDGIARGVDEHGALQIEHGGQRERFMAGHLTAIGPPCC